MRIALSIAVAFSIASSAGTWAYLDAKTAPAAPRRELAAGVSGHGASHSEEIVLAPKSR